MKRKDEFLIQLIKSVQLDSPSPDFTEDVMAFLKEESTLVEKMDVISEHTLKRDLLPSVPKDFSMKTMKALEDSVKKSDIKPLLSQKTTTIVMGTFAIGYAFLILDEFFLNILYVSDESLFKVEWFQELSNISPVFWISIVVVTILLLLDSNIKNNVVLNQ